MLDHAHKAAKHEWRRSKATVLIEKKIQHTSTINLSFACGVGLAPPKSEKVHKWIRARSSLARPSAKVAPLKALKKLKACLCTSAQEEKLPLFQIPSLGYRRGMDVTAKVLLVPTPSEHVKRVPQP